MEQKKKQKERVLKIQKSNSLALHSIFDFTDTEMDVTNYITTRLKPEDGGKITQNICEINFSELCRLTGIQRNGASYKNYLQSIKTLREKSVILNDGRFYTPLFWIEDWVYDKTRGVALIKLSQKILPYISNLRNRFLLYDAAHTFLMRGKYPKRMYEEIKAYFNANNKGGEAVYRVNVENLKVRLCIEDKPAYVNFNNFKTKILDVSLKEINNRTDINVRYDTEKKGRRVDCIIFYISIKSKEELERVEEENRKMMDAVSETELDSEDFEFDVDSFRIASSEEDVHAFLEKYRDDLP